MSKNDVGWGMLLSLLAYDGLVNASNVLEALLSMVPLLGDSLTALLNSLSGLVALVVFFVFYVRVLWRGKYVLTTMAGIVSPFIPIILPLPSAVFILEKKIIHEN